MEGNKPEEFDQLRREFGEKHIPDLEDPAVKKGSEVI